MRSTLFASLLLLGACNTMQPAQEKAPEFQVIIHEYAEAAEMAKTLTKLTGGAVTGSEQVKFMSDTRTNSLLVLASQEQLPPIKDLIARLDVEVADTESR
jgi:type II secretory pathway component GspD/PulD (secretin)